MKNLIRQPPLTIVLRNQKFSIKTDKRGKNQKVKTENIDKLLEVVQKNLKDELLLKNAYSFQLKDRQVKVVFSDNHNAYTMEDALVKIAKMKIG